jgi:hypothetical protein
VQDFQVVNGISHISAPAQPPPRTWAGNTEPDNCAHDQQQDPSPAHSALLGCYGLLLVAQSHFGIFDCLLLQVADFLKKNNCRSSDKKNAQSYQTMRRNDRERVRKA